MRNNFLSYTQDTPVSAWCQEVPKRLPTDIHECFTLGTMNIDFGQWLAAEIEKRGWKQADLEREAGGDISGPQISRIISTSRGYESPSVRAIARALKMPQAEVFYLAGLLTENPQAPQIGDPLKADIWQMIDRMEYDQLMGIRMLAEMVLSRGTNESKRGVDKDR